MGGLRRYMPITWITCLVGIVRANRFSRHRGLFLEGRHHRGRACCRTRPAPTLGYWLACLVGVFVTALYSFRLRVPGVPTARPRMDEHTREHLHETPAVVMGAARRACHPVRRIIGAIAIEPMLFGNYLRRRASSSHRRDNDVLGRTWGTDYHGVRGLHLATVIAAAAVLARHGRYRGCVVFVPAPAGSARAAWPTACRNRAPCSYSSNEVRFRHVQRMVFCRRRAWYRAVSLWQAGDVTVIDGLLVNGSRESGRLVVGCDAARSSRDTCTTTRSP